MTHWAIRHPSIGNRIGVFTAAVAIGLAIAPLRARGIETTFVPFGASWKYLDNGSDQGTAWRSAGFADSGWSSGPAELGYGDGDEATVVSFGPSSGSKYITTYFRHTFSVSDASSYGEVDLAVVRDDGAVVYLNGQEIFRTNMPGGTIGYTTPASGAIGGSAESQSFTTTVNPNLLIDGSNTLAVEIHQANATSSDISFNLRLSASDGSLTRGPYLQLGTPTSIVIRWRTGAATNSRVRYGASPAALTAVADDGAVTTEHEVALTGLAPGTTYYYSVGTTSTALAGGDSDHFFVTPPLTGTAASTRVWVIGDSGTGDANAAMVRNAYETFAGARHTDLWLMLGDNAYNSGTDSEYQTAVFDMYPARLRQTVLWPTLGNHDGASADSGTQSGPYYDMFTLPAQSEAGGVTSGTEAYYSFDHGNIHFICLDSQDSDRSPGADMMNWLEDDLVATDADWIIAFWHHPPYTKGSHDSDTESELRQMRENALPILDDYGVDLVLAGHSHSYERSILLDSHYGASNTLTGAMIIDGGDGRTDGNGAYEKTTLGPGPHEGAVYVVAGSSGKISGGALNHPVMLVSLNQLGSVVLDINGNTLDAKFVRETGAVTDYFTIVKGGAVPPTATFTPTSTRTATSTPPWTATATSTATATPTQTATSTSTAATSPTSTATATPSRTATNTATPTATQTATSTATRTATPTNTALAGCDLDGSCEPGENCTTCPGDCPVGSTASCGNGICEAADGEDCVTCPADCRGKQSGKTSGRFCCGDGDGQNPLPCSNSQCTRSGFQCTDVPAPSSCCGDGSCTGGESGASCPLDCGVPAACGDGTCNGSETPCSCATDCGAAPSAEIPGATCADQADNDCDGAVDCGDADCAADPGCISSCALTGASCVINADCCSKSCKGKSGRATCR